MSMSIRPLSCFEISQSGLRDTLLLVPYHPPLWSFGVIREQLFRHPLCELRARSGRRSRRFFCSSFGEFRSALVRSSCTSQSRRTSARTCPGSNGPPTSPHMEVALTPAFFSASFAPRRSSSPKTHPPPPRAGRAPRSPHDSGAVHVRLPPLSSYSLLLVGALVPARFITRARLSRASRRRYRGTGPSPPGTASGS
jgi:hypothetical protein